MTERALRIAYLVHGVGGRETGVRTKILAQAATWRRLDAEVEVGLFVRCEAGTEEAWRTEAGVVSVRSSRLAIPGRLVARELLSADVEEWRPHVVYLRHSTVSPSVLRLMARIPTVVEMNTRPLVELAARSWLRFLYARATLPGLLRHAAGVVAVSSDVARDVRVRGLPLRIAVVPNGVDLSTIRPLPPASNPAPRLVFVGSPGLPWHGVDKLEELARQFPSWQFDIVGPTQAAGPPNVTRHGAMAHDDLMQILARADVGIGSLAMHRVGLNDASPLKVGEYLAYGLPVIIGYTDTRFPDGAPFLLRVPNADDGISSSVAEIDSFVTSWKGRRVARAELQPIDATGIERRRLDFIRATLRELEGSA